MKDSIPIFPPFCAVDAPITECTFFDITLPCRQAITRNGPFALGTVQGHIWVYFVLTVIGILALTYIPFPWKWKDSMKVTTALYSIETAFFAIFRNYWGLGRPLIVGAALHNLFEWSIIIHLANGTKNFHDFRQAMRFATYFICIVVSLGLMIPDLMDAFLVEQSTGITLDFAMLLMFLMKWWGAKDDEVKQFYRLPAIAHTIHLLFTIIPLVYANFHVGFVSWYSTFFLELAIYASAPVTHLAYCVWAKQVDNLKNPQSTTTGEKRDETAGLLPDKYRIKGVWKYLISGFVMGLLSLVGIPFGVMGVCPEQPQCLPNEQITRTSIVEVHPGRSLALEDLVATTKLVETAQKSSGNMGYDFIMDVQNPNQYRLLEKWQSQAHLQAWLNGFEKDIFASKAMKGLLVGESLKEVYEYTTPTSASCRPREVGSIKFDVEASCDVVWDIVGNWHDCSWVMGCTHAITDDPSNNSAFGDMKSWLRIMYMDNGQIIHAYRHKQNDLERTLIYEFTKPNAIAGYIGSLAINSKEADGGGSCEIDFEFQIPRGIQMMTVAYDYDLFYESRIPFLKDFFKDKAKKEKMESTRSSELKQLNDGNDEGKKSSSSSWFWN